MTEVSNAPETIFVFGTCKVDVTLLTINELACLYHLFHGVWEATENAVNSPRCTDRVGSIADHFMLELSGVRETIIQEFMTRHPRSNSDWTTVIGVVMGDDAHFFDTAEAMLSKLAHLLERRPDNLIAPASTPPIHESTQCY